MAYNDANLVRRCLDTLGEFDEIIVCEGKYDVNPCEDGPHSTDGTLEILKEYHPKVTILDCAGKRQTEARNMYLEEAAKRGCDWVVVLESDEYITSTKKEFFKKNRTCSLEVFKKNLPSHQRHRTPRDLIYNLRCEDVFVNATYPYLTARLIYKPQYVRYGGVHHSYVVNGKERLAYNDSTVPVIEGIYIHHDERARTPEQQGKAHMYGTVKLTEQEKEARRYLVENGLIL